MLLIKSNPDSIKSISSVFILLYLSQTRVDLLFLIVVVHWYRPNAWQRSSWLRIADLLQNPLFCHWIKNIGCDHRFKQKAIRTRSCLVYMTTDSNLKEHLVGCFFTNDTNAMRKKCAFICCRAVQLPPFEQLTL